MQLEARSRAVAAAASRKMLSRLAPSSGLLILSTGDGFFVLFDGY